MLTDSPVLSIVNNYVETSKIFTTLSVSQITLVVPSYDYI